MWEYIEERVRTHAEYILQTGCTVRACAAHFQTSKSTVHKDVTERLREFDLPLYRDVRAVLDKNLNEIKNECEVMKQQITQLQHDWDLKNSNNVMSANK